MYFNERECLRAMCDAGINTWSELSEKTGIPRKTVYNIRIGDCVPNLEQAFLMADVLRLDDYRFWRVFPRR